MLKEPEASLSDPREQAEVPLLVETLSAELDGGHQPEQDYPTFHQCFGGTVHSFNMASQERVRWMFLKFSRVLRSSQSTVKL